MNEHCIYIFLCLNFYTIFFLFCRKVFKIYFGYVTCETSMLVKSLQNKHLLNDEEHEQQHWSNLADSLLSAVALSSLLNINNKAIIWRGYHPCF